HSGPVAGVGEGVAQAALGALVAQDEPRPEQRALAAAGAPRPEPGEQHGSLRRLLVHGEVPAAQLLRRHSRERSDRGTPTASSTLEPESRSALRAAGVT